MTKQLLTFLSAAALAACGSSSPSKMTTPPVDNPPSIDAGPSTNTPVAADASTAPVAEIKPVEPPPPDIAKVRADLLVAENLAYDQAKPVFVTFCAKCHMQGGKKASKKKLDHFDMTVYPMGGHHVGTMGPTIREVLGLEGKKAVMPIDKPGSVKGADLALVVTWAAAWQAANDAGPHPPAPPEGPDDD